MDVQELDIRMDALEIGVAKISVDIAWIKKIVIAAAVLMSGLFGIDVTGVL